MIPRGGNHRCLPGQPAGTRGELSYYVTSGEIAQQKYCALEAFLFFTPGNGSGTVRELPSL